MAEASVTPTKAKNQDVELLFQKMGEKLGWFQHKDLDTAMKSLTKSSKKKSTKSRVKHKSGDLDASNKENKVSKVSRKEDSREKVKKHKSKSQKPVGKDGSTKQSVDSQSVGDFQGYPLKPSKASTNLTTDPEKEKKVLRISEIPLETPKPFENKNLSYGSTNQRLSNEGSNYSDSFPEMPSMLEDIGAPLVESTRIHSRESISFYKLGDSNDSSGVLDQSSFENLRISSGEGGCRYYRQDKTLIRVRNSLGVNELKKSRQLDISDKYFSVVDESVLGEEEEEFHSVLEESPLGEESHQPGKRAVPHLLEGEKKISNKIETDRRSKKSSEDKDIAEQSGPVNDSNKQSCTNFEKKEHPTVAETTTEQFENNLACSKTPASDDAYNTKSKHHDSLERNKMNEIRTQYRDEHGSKSLPVEASEDSSGSFYEVEDACAQTDFQEFGTDEDVRSDSDGDEGATVIENKMRKMGLGSHFGQKGLDLDRGTQNIGLVRDGQVSDEKNTDIRDCTEDINNMSLTDAYQNDERVKAFEENTDSCSGGSERDVLGDSSSDSLTSDGSFYEVVDQCVQTEADMSQTDHIESPSTANQASSNSVTPDSCGSKSSIYFQQGSGSLSGTPRLAQLQSATYEKLRMSLKKFPVTPNHTVKLMENVLKKVNLFGAKPSSSGQKALHKTEDFGTDDATCKSEDLKKNDATCKSEDLKKNVATCKSEDLMKNDATCKREDLKKNDATCKSEDLKKNDATCFDKPGEGNITTKKSDNVSCDEVFKSDKGSHEECCKSYVKDRSDEKKSESDDVMTDSHYSGKHHSGSLSEMRNVVSTMKVTVIPESNLEQRVTKMNENDYIKMNYVTETEKINVKTEASTPLKSLPLETPSRRTKLSLKKPHKKSSSISSSASEGNKELYKTGYSSADYGCESPEVKHKPESQISSIPDHRKNNTATVIPNSPPLEDDNGSGHQSNGDDLFSDGGVAGVPDSESEDEFHSVCVPKHTESTEKTDKSQMSSADEKVFTKFDVSSDEDEVFKVKKEKSEKGDNSTGSSKRAVSWKRHDMSDDSLPDIDTKPDKDDRYCVTVSDTSTWRSSKTVSESSEEDDFDAFLQKIKTSKKTKKLKSSSESSESDVDSMKDFIVDDSDVESELDEDIFYLKTDNSRKEKNPRVPRYITSSDEESAEESFTESDESEEEIFRKKKPKQNRPRKTSEKPQPRVVQRVYETPKSQIISSSVVPSSVKSSSTTVKTASFLRSLSTELSEYKRHPDAVIYVKQFKKYKGELTQRLMKLYNLTVFDNKLPSTLSISWNNRMLKTAGYCKYMKHHTASVELSDKVCDSAERVRDTLIHELCHAASWVLNHKNDGHGPYWKYWARKANKSHPELPVISRCHSYAIATKYTYKCVGCGYSIGRHSKSLDTDRKVCGKCHSRFEVFLTKDTPSSTSSSLSKTPKTPRTPNRFALFVKEKYGEYKKNKDLKHKDIMQLLSQEFAAKNKLND